MQLSSGTSAEPLSPAFSGPAFTSKIHTLQAGHSMLVGYPGSSYGHGVFLLSYIDESTSQYMAFQVNGPKQSSLHNIIRIVLNIEDPLCPDIPVLGGGAMEDSRVFIMTPIDWHPEITSYISGNMRIHAAQEALMAIASGDLPQQMSLYLGYVQGTFANFKKALLDNQLGEIATDEDLIFGSYAPDTVWKKAMEHHTGGHFLHIPPVADKPHLPCDDVKPEARLIN